MFRLPDLCSSAALTASRPLQLSRPLRKVGAWRLRAFLLELDFSSLTPHSSSVATLCAGEVDVLLGLSVRSGGIVRIIFVRGVVFAVASPASAVAPFRAIPPAFRTAPAFSGLRVPVVAPLLAISVASAFAALAVAAVGRSAGAARAFLSTLSPVLLALRGSPLAPTAGFAAALGRAVLLRRPAPLAPLPFLQLRRERPVILAPPPPPALPPPAPPLPAALPS